MSSKIPYSTVAKHNTPDDVWVIIHGKVWDLTDFAEAHPGGENIIYKFAGKDATEAFEPYHPKDIVDTLPKEFFKGFVDPATVPPPEPKQQKKQVSDLSSQLENQMSDKKDEIPPIEAMLNIFDFAPVAKRNMTSAGWAYYDSGADDEITLKENHDAFKRLWLRPKVLIDVDKIEMKSKILGHSTSLPLYITATALGKLAHPDGELALTRAAYNEEIIQMMPTLASATLDEMQKERKGDQVQFFQLYVNSDRDLTKRIVQRAEKGGAKGLFLTVDAPMLGRRERDMRHKFNAQAPDVQIKKKAKVKRSKGTARAISAFIDRSLQWSDIPWFQSITKMPIILKGVQCGFDAIKAYKYGCQGIVVSNHGARQLDTARPGIEVLPEVMDALRSVGAVGKIEVYVDGGIRRGTDIFKALALGATAVGIGRPALYGLAAYGQEGVERVLQMFKEEFEICMRLMGCKTIADIEPYMVVQRAGDTWIQPNKSKLTSKL